MPCSPDSEPPSSTHSSAISPESCSARSVSPGVGVVEHQRVQVAVAGVEDVGHPQPGLVAHLGDPVEHLGEPGAGHHAVLHEVVGGDPADRGERRLAAPPDRRALVGGARDVQPGAAVLLADRLDLLELDAALLGGAVQLDDQRGGHADRVARVHGLLGGLDGQRVHHLDGGRHDARGDDVAHDVARRRRSTGSRRAACAPTRARAAAAR